MSEMPPNHDQPDDVDAIYRRASALDSSRPSDGVRSAVFAYAAQLAAQRANGDGARTNSARPTTYHKGWRPAVFRTLAAAALAGILTAPYLLTPRVPSGMADPSAAPSRAPRQAPAAPRAFTTDEAPKPLNSPGRPEITSVPQRKALAQHNTGSGHERAASEGQPTSRSEDHVSAQSKVTVEAQRRSHTQASSASAALRSDPTPAPPAPDIPSDPAAPAATLWKAAETGDLPGLQASLDAQVDIEARDATGRTALMIATLNGRTDAVQLLLARGANPNAADTLGTTPLQAAAAGHQRAIIKALKRAGALE